MAPTDRRLTTPRPTGRITDAMNKPSPHKQADPLRWPFGRLDPKEWARLKRQQPKPVYPPAPF